jgi:hypothetical protein
MWSMVEGVYHVTYDELLNNYLETMRGVQDRFNLTKKHSRIKRIKEYVGVDPRSRQLTPEYDDEDIAYIEQVLNG